ncbi:hypothetical protein HPB50_010878 [Hyalomma asiaticum]|uniref:Uncharacterized protein n=1 Tax=Hyalomma asiaticum TaxID=266040 RepID=A0ACB7RIV6_HYAAI|nr:hypothetical protein HPB50_010878 [Hyalomma asiaticum]
MQIDIVCLPWDPGIERVGSDQGKAPATPLREPQRTAQTREHAEAVPRTAASHRLITSRPTLRPDARFQTHTHSPGALRMSIDVHCRSHTGARVHVDCSTRSVFEPQLCNGSAYLNNVHSLSCNITYRENLVMLLGAEFKSGIEANGGWLHIFR